MIWILLILLITPRICNFWEIRAHINPGVEGAFYTPEGLFNIKPCYGWCHLENICLRMKRKHQ